jgi:hypothetical protein
LCFVMFAFEGFGLVDSTTNLASMYN